MMKYGLLLCILAGSNIVTANVLPATIVRGVVPAIKSCTALIVCKSEGFKISPQETRKALLQEEKNLNGRHLEWTRHIEILKSALQAAEKERGIVTEQLCWIKAAQDRMGAKLKGAEPKSPCESKDLTALEREEHAIIGRILSIKEITTNFYNPGPNGSFWNSQRSSEARVQYEMRLREAYDKLAEVRRYKKTLKNKDSNND